MKKWIFFATFMSLMSLTAQAQFDDVYYDPARDNRSTTTRTQTSQQRYDNNGTQPNSDADYYDNNNANRGGDYYEYDDEYDDYAYSTRIRRFHRPLRGFDYYNNAYVDYGYYDPNYYDRYFYRPSVTIVLGNSYWNRWNRYNRWNNSIWFNRYWDDWCYTSYGLYNPYSFYSYYSPFGYSSYYSPYGYSSWNDPYFNGGWGYNRYNRYNNPYQTGHTNVNTPLSNAGNTYYGPRKSGGAIREVTGPSGQVTTGRRGDVNGNPTPNPVKTNIPARADVKKEAYNESTSGNGGGVTPVKRYQPVPSDGRTEGVTDRPTRTTERPAPSYDRPTRTTDRPAPNYDRPQRTTETTPSSDRPTRTYERPAPNYDRPQRSMEASPSSDRPTRTYDRPQRTEAPRYEAPRQESRSYSPPASSSPSHQSSSPAPSHNSGGGASRSSGGRSRNE